MKTILSSRKHPYITRVGIFLIALALIVGTLSCGSVEYDLTMAVSPPGSGTTTPTGTASYVANTSVDIQAVANPGYQFAIWTAEWAGTFANANAPSTTFTMPDQDVTVTAHFVAALDHFRCYAAANVTGLPIGEVVYLEDQFCAVNATVIDVWPEWLGGMEEGGVFFCDPVEKVHAEVTTPISNPDHHLTVYSLNCSEEEPQPHKWGVLFNNQFGTMNMTVSGPVALAVPTQKAGHGPPVGLDHFLIYQVVENYGYSVNVTVNLKDQFREDIGVLVYESVLFANPVRKTHGGNVTEIVNPEAHLIFYAISAEFWEGPEVQVVNQFGEQTFNLFQDPVIFAVPSAKLYGGPIP
jgi:hypothetical protein